MPDEAGMKVDLPYIFRDRDRYGAERVYVRIQGKNGGKKRLRAAPGSPEFLTEYRAALDALKVAPPPPKTALYTLRWLVREFEASPKFTRVTFREQRNRHLLVRAALDEPHKPGSNLLIGDCELRFFDGKLARVLRDRKAKTPSAANHRLANLRLIFNWGLEERPEQVKINPFIGVKPIEHRAKGWYTWTEDEVARYEARHPVGSQARLALDLMLYTGARRGDVVKLGPRNFRQVKNPQTAQMETWIAFTPSKTSKSTGNVVELPILPQLRESLAATPHGLTAFLINSYGKPHASGDSFANWFKDRVREAGLDDHCGPHGLRKVGAVRCALMGLTAKQMMAIFGWSTERLATLYTEMADKRRLVAGSVHALDPKGSV